MGGDDPDAIPVPPHSNAITIPPGSTSTDPAASHLITVHALRDSAVSDTGHIVS